MTWFLFAGDMLVMLFMAALAVWVFWRSPDSAMDRAGSIPLADEADGESGASNGGNASDVDKASNAGNAGEAKERY